MDELTQIVLAAQIDECMYLNAALDANEGLLIRMSRGVSISGMEWEDVYSELKYRLIKSIRKYDVSQGPWQAYAIKHLDWSIKALIKQRTNSERWKLDNCYELQEWEGFAPESGYDSIEALMVAMDVLDDCDRELLVTYFFEDKTMTQIAKEEGVTPQWISMRMAGARKKLALAMST